MVLPKTIDGMSLVRPAVLLGKINGQLPDSILYVVDRPGVPVVRLVAVAAQAWDAMVAAALSDWIALSVTGSYRTYAQQETLFRARYTTTYLAGRPWKLWQGKRWYLRGGMATAAVPGTSNHGWGLAVDVANASGSRLQWLINHAAEFGFAWELDAEPWHIRYMTGDRIPPAVINYEGGDVLSDQDIEKIVTQTKQRILADGGMQQLFSRVAGLVDADDHAAKQMVILTDAVGELAAKLDSIVIGTVEHTHDVGASRPVS